MIDFKKLKARRKELGISQVELAEKVSKLSKQSFSQQAVFFIEKGETKRSKFLPYICQVLDLKLTDIDSTISKSVDEDIADIFAKVKSLPKSEQVAIAQQILANLQDS